MGAPWGRCNMPTLRNRFPTREPNDGRTAQPCMWLLPKLRFRVQMRSILRRIYYMQEHRGALGEIVGGVGQTELYSILYNDRVYRSL